jgi:DNA (cytosine-5)-methyltransferase 1
MRQLNELALFAGAGGGILGGHLLGWKTVCAVEYNAYARSVLLARQNDRTLAPFPIWDDVRTFDGKPWRGIVDVVSGGFPCQDISVAGKGAGLDGERSGLWTEQARIIREIQPRFAYMENSPALTIRGLGIVLGDLAEMGFDVEWGVISAADTGAKHDRERIWILADSVRKGWQGDVSKQNTRSSSTQSQFRFKNRVRDWCHSWPAEPAVGRVVNGMAHRVDRLKAIGNGQVPRVAATAFRELTA